MKVHKIIVIFNFSHYEEKSGIYSIPISFNFSASWIIYQGNANASGYGTLPFYTIIHCHDVPEGAQLIKSIPDYKLSYLDD